MMNNLSTAATKQRIQDVYLKILDGLMDYSLNTEESRIELVRIAKEMTIRSIKAIDEIDDELSRKV